LSTILLYLSIVLSSPEDGRLRPKHVAKYNLIVIIAPCLNACCVLTVQNILYKVNPLQITHSIHPYLRRSCLKFYMSLQLPRTPQVIKSKCLRVIGNYPRRSPTSHLHDPLNDEPIAVFILRLRVQFSLTALPTPALWFNKSDLHCSRPDLFCARNTNPMTAQHSAVTSSPTVTVFLSFLSLLLFVCTPISLLPFYKYLFRLDRGTIFLFFLQRCCTSLQFINKRMHI